MRRLITALVLAAGLIAALLVTVPGQAGAGGWGGPHPQASCGPHRHHPCPSPSPSPAPTPTPTGTGRTWSCTVTGPDVSCPTAGNGNYHDYPAITMSNGWGTYVADNCLDDGACPHQVLQANAADDWQVTATEPAGDTSVETGPELQQQANDWCPAEHTWDSTLPGGCANEGDTPVSQLAGLTSTYTETFPHNARTVAEAAYDIWTGYSADIMVWTDTLGRCEPGAFGQTLLASAVQIGGKAFDVRRYGASGGEIIFTEENGAPGTCAQDSSGTVDLLGVLREAQALGILTAATAHVGLIDFTFEICSTGGGPETFGVSRYTITGAPS